MVDESSRSLIAKCQFCGKLNSVEAARVGDLPKCGECATPTRLARPVRVTDRDFDRIMEPTRIPDANPVVPQRFTIRGKPTLIAFRDGEEAGRHVGLADRLVMEVLVGASPPAAADIPPD